MVLVGDEGNSAGERKSFQRGRVRGQGCFLCGMQQIDQEFETREHRGILTVRQRPDRPEG